MQINLIHIICFIAIFQSLFLAILVYNSKNGSRISNTICSLIMIIFAFLIGCSFMQSDAHWRTFARYHKIIFSVFQLSLLIGPMLYLYSKSLLYKSFLLRKKHILHFIPFFVITLYLLLKVVLTKDLRLFRTPFWYISSIIIVMQSLTYLIFVLRMLFKHFSSLKSFFLKVENPKIMWLRLFICGYILLWIIQIHTFVITEIWFLGTFDSRKINFYFITAFIFINAISYIAFKTPEIFLRKYQKSYLNGKDKEEYLEQIINYIEKEKQYLDSSLTISSLSKKLSINVSYISQIINETYNQHFHDFINKYRIQESQCLLDDCANNDLNILQIAFQVGFNSKSAFNRAFKKHTGQTPTEFKKNNSL